MEAVLWMIVGACVLVLVLSFVNPAPPEDE